MTDKKRILIFILFISVSAFTLFATGMPGVNPQSGGFGINMASTHYNFDENLYYGKNANEKNIYNEYHMVAIGGVYNIESTITEDYVLDSRDEWESSQSKIPMTIRIDCPNGFYFESISNPGARRPFKLYAVISNSYSKLENVPGDSGQNGKTKGTTIVKSLEEGINVLSDIKYEYVTSNNYHEYSGDDLPDREWYESDLNGHDFRYQYMWFDLVLCLPYDKWDSGSSSYVSSNGRMMYNGQYYDLVEEDDYSAVITVTVSWGEDERSVSIPLSGYYSKNINGETSDKSASLSVRPRAAASNLNIQTMAGVEVDVADIAFMADISVRQPNDEPDGYRPSEGGVYVPEENDYYIFLSASRNPNDSDPNGFRLVHTKAANPTNPNLNEFLGFDLLLKTNDSSNSSDNGTTTIFDGTEHINGSNLPDNSITVPTRDSTPADYFSGWYYELFDWHFDWARDDNFQGDFNYTGKTVNYAFYDGTISVVMDQPSVEVMREGRYEEEVYVHIISNGE